MITSCSNGQIKNIIKLIKSSKARKEQGLYVVEGIRMFKEIPEGNLEQVYITQNFYDKNPDMFHQIKYELVTESVLKEASDTKTPQGIMAIVKQPGYTRDEVAGQPSPCLLILENLQDPGNLGTIFRTAEGAGVNGIILSKDCVDIFNPKVTRSTMGAVFRMPFIYVDDLEKEIQYLKDQQVTIYAAHLNGNSFYEENYIAGTAFLIGNEGNGLTDSISALADRKIKIPMCGKVESLNAAIAATVLMYEVMRQRLS